jgi:hypothetical protein
VEEFEEFEKNCDWWPKAAVVTAMTATRPKLRSP